MVPLQIVLKFSHVFSVSNLQRKGLWLTTSFIWDVASLAARSPDGIGHHPYVTCLDEKGRHLIVEVVASEVRTTI